MQAIYTFFSINKNYIYTMSTLITDKTSKISLTDEKDFLTHHVLTPCIYVFFFFEWEIFWSSEM